MPALKPTGLTGTITWLGIVADRDAALRSEPLVRLAATFAGVEGEDHGGLTRLSCSRVTALYPRGTEIRNTRQLSIVSDEELAAIAAEIGVDSFDPAWIGATMVVSGLPDFTHIPPSSRLQASSGVTLTVDMESRPCTLPHPVIEADAPGHGATFRAAAKGRRGVTAWVERVQVGLGRHDLASHPGSTLLATVERRGCEAPVRRGRIEDAPSPVGRGALPASPEASPKRPAVPRQIAACRQLPTRSLRQTGFRMASPVSDLPRNVLPRRSRGRKCRKNHALHPAARLWVSL